MQRGLSVNKTLKSGISHIKWHKNNKKQEFFRYFVHFLLEK